MIRTQGGKGGEINSGKGVTDNKVPGQENPIRDGKGGSYICGYAYWIWE